MSPILRAVLWRAVIAGLAAFVMEFLREYPKEQERQEKELERIEKEAIKLAKGR